MRIQYPEEIDRMIDSIEDYIIFDGQECILASDAPEGTQETLDAIKAKMKQFREYHTITPPV